jgi:DNA-binding HxlR family transcriptional regulator
MAIPTPGKPVRGSRSGQPIMALFDLLGRRWAMGIVWNLSEGPCTFRELQSRCETISPTILNRRLKELQESHLIERSSQGYCLTPMGKQLYQLLVPLGQWSKSWAKKF